MWFPESGSRRVIYLYVVVLILVELQMVGAIRVFPGNNAVANKVEFSHRIIIDDNNSKSKNKNRDEDLFKKYFGGRSTFAPTTTTTTSSNNSNNTTTTTQTGFDDSKRRVPSCPDPLHN